MIGNPAGARRRRAQAAAHRLTEAGYRTPVRCACPKHLTTTENTTHTPEMRKQ